MVKKVKPTASEDRNVARLRSIVQIFEASSLCTMNYEDEDIDVQLSRVGDTVSDSVSMPARVASQPAAPGPVPTPPAPVPSVEAEGTVVRSPIVGTFYEAPGPGTPPFTAVGATVKKGQTLCIIEAMKLMNEIESDVTGTVLEVLVDNEKPVQYDQPLFRIAVKS